MREEAAWQSNTCTRYEFLLLIREKNSCSRERFEIASLISGHWLVAEGLSW
jgi:hypothetical protein